ncbi:MAG: P44/Msp2 family outer membrane protein [Prochlorococcaceae cyanobacterium]
MIPLLFALPPAPVAAAAASPQQVQLAQAAPAAVVVPAPAPTYPYVSAQLGVAFPNDYDGDFDAGAVPVNTRFELDPGFNGELAIGYQFERARTELAVGYGNFPVASQSFRVGNLGNASASGSDALAITTVMVNGYYDMPIQRDGVRSRWTPYLGAGIGYANISTPDCSFGSGCFEGGDASAFAYQGKVGVSYRASERGFAFLEGGYLGATGTVVDGVGFDNFGAWRLNIGWRQGFGGAPKKAAVLRAEPAAAAEPATVTEPVPEAAPLPVRGLW